MAFLDNSGDIILDAVLTDAGRKRLARGDGTFKVTKYAFGDDEIDYSSYNASHASGSAYYDLEILQTPILEAFTNNRSSLKSRLVSITNNNLLYMPEMMLNEVNDLTARATSNELSTGSFVVTCTEDTQTSLSTLGGGAGGQALDGRFIAGNSIPTGQAHPHIRVDQGLNTTKLGNTTSLTAELKEQQYMIQIDNRLGSITDTYLQEQGSPSFIDDDQIATYYITQAVGAYIANCQPGPLTGQNHVGKGSNYDEIITGPRGTKLRFGILASSNLKTSHYLFETLGTTGIVDSVTGETYETISTTVKVTGVTTGYSIDIPITFVRQTS
jgi:hypothetical protein